MVAAPPAAPASLISFQLCQTLCHVWRWHAGDDRVLSNPEAGDAAACPTCDILLIFDEQLGLRLPRTRGQAFAEQAAAE